MNVINFTILVLVIYLLFLKLISYFAYKNSTNNSEDYFLSGRKVGMFALVCTTMASIFSTATVVSAPSEFFTKGINYFWIFLFTLTPVCMIFFVFKFWKLGKIHGFISPGELMAYVYDSRVVQAMTGIIGVVALIPYSAVQLVAIGKTFESLTNSIITYEIGITIVAAAIGLYLFFGGSRAVIWTDVVQGIIFSSLLIISGILTVKWAGGWENVVSNLSLNHPKKAAFKDIGINYYQFLLPCAFFFLLPHVWQRMYMADSPKTLAKNILILPIVFSGLFFVTWIMGSAALVIFPEGLADGDSVLGAIFHTNAPYFGAFVLVAAFAAGMSTVDSQLLSAGSILTRDFKLLLSSSFPSLNKINDYKFARISTVTLLVLIWIWSFSLKDQSLLALVLMGFTAAVTMAPAVIGAFYIKYSSATGAFLSMFLGILVFLLREFTTIMPFNISSAWWATIISFGVFFIAVIINFVLFKKKLVYFES